MNTRLTTLFLVVLGAVVIAEAALLFDLRGQLADIEERLERSADQLADLAHAANKAEDESEAPDDVADEIARSNRRVRALTRRVEALEAGGMADLGIEDLVDRKLGERLAAAGRPGRAALTKGSDLGELARALDLSDGQVRQVAGIVDRTKDEVATLFGDGTEGTFQDQIVKVLQSGRSPEEKRRRLLSKMFSEQTADGEGNYVSALLDIRGRALDDLQGVLTADQLDRYHRSGIKLFGIRTGHSPVADDLKDRILGE